MVEPEMYGCEFSMLFQKEDRYQTYNFSQCFLKEFQMGYIKANYTDSSRKSYRLDTGIRNFIKCPIHVEF